MALLLVSRPMSPVSWLVSLSPVLCPLSHGSAPCLPSYVPCLTALLLVLCPLYSVNIKNYPSVPFYVALFHWSCPSLLCLPSSVPPSLVLCPLSFILARMRVFLYMQTFDGWLRAGTVLVLFPLSHVFVLCLPFYVPCLRAEHNVCCPTTFDGTEEINQLTTFNSLPLRRRGTLHRRIFPSVDESTPP
jgi:hypothetical protein